MTKAEDLDHTPLSKGKYGRIHKTGGLTPSRVAEIDPSYLVWCYENWVPKPCSELLYRDCLKDIRRSPGQRESEEEEERRADRHFGVDVWGQG